MRLATRRVFPQTQAVACSEARHHLKRDRNPLLKAMLEALALEGQFLEIEDANRMRVGLAVKNRSSRTHHRQNIRRRPSLRTRNLPQ